MVRAHSKLDAEEDGSSFMRLADERMQEAQGHPCFQDMVWFASHCRSSAFAPPCAPDPGRWATTSSQEYARTTYSFLFSSPQITCVSLNSSKVMAKRSSVEGGGRPSGSGRSSGPSQDSGKRGVGRPPPPPPKRSIKPVSAPPKESKTYQGCMDSLPPESVLR
jgi:hypothetical protein